MQLSKKQKIVPQCFAAFLKSTSNCEHFEQKDHPHNLCISENENCEKTLFITAFDSQPVKGSQTLLKSAWQHFYHIF